MTRDFDLTIPPDPHYLAEIRRLVREELDHWDVPSGIIDSFVVVINELATNTIIHTAAAANLRIIHNHLLRVEVTDTNPDPPEPRPAGHHDPDYGSGLTIVAELVDGWGYQRTATGKTIWCELLI
jgi:anti-sigma regulatory factor (Ser/Thr protein kinase)